MKTQRATAAPVASRRDARGRISAFALLTTAALVLLPLGQSAQAHIGEPVPIGDPATGPDTEIRITATGPGLSLPGLEPATPTTQDPAAPYPATNPAGYTPVSTFAGTIITSSIADPTLSAAMYCINLRVATQAGIGYESGTWAESNVPNIGYVTYILNNYYPTTSEPAGLTPSQQAAAVQAAIWYFTDGYVVSTTGTTTSNVVRAAVATIVADTQANGPVVEPSPPDVSITPPTSSAAVGTPAGPFTVAAEGAASVTVSVPNGFQMYADQAGSVPLTNPSTVASGTQVWVGSAVAEVTDTVLRARAAVTVQRGEVYLYDGYTPDLADAQRLILANTTVLEATTNATASFFAVGTVTVDKTFAGDALGQQGPSQLVVDCGEGYTFTADIAAGAEDTQTFTYSGIPVGATCVVTEPATGAGTAVDVTTDAPQQAEVTAEGATITVTNTVSFRPGGLSVTKTITGEAAGDQGTIVLGIVCGTVLDETFTIAGGSAAGDYRQTYSGLPAGTECTVTETATGASNTVLVDAGEPVTVTVPPGATVDAAMTNIVSPVPPAPPVNPVDPGEQPAPSSPSGLASTGSDVTSTALSTAAALMAFGAVLAASARRRHRSSRS